MNISNIIASMIQDMLENDGYTEIYTLGKLIHNEQYTSELEKRGVTVAISDLARCDMHEAIEDAFRYDRLVLASSTYNADVFPYMRTFLSGLTERNYQNRRVAFIENGSWAPMATKVMKASLEKSKNLSYADTEVRIMSALNDESKAQIIALSEEFSK